jgi:hypothetical protein
MYGLCVHVGSNLKFGDLLNEQKTRKNGNDSSSKAGYTHEGWALDV